MLLTFGMMAILLGIGYVSLARPNSVINMSVIPGPSVAIRPGEQEYITWVITPDTQQPPMETVFTIINQDNDVIVQETYASQPGLFGPYTYVYTLPVTYIVPPHVPFEKYIAKVDYTSGSGEAIGAYVTFFVSDKTGALRIVKYDDLNLNGVRDPGEPTVPGVIFRLRFPPPFTDTLLLTQTNSAGEIVYPQLGAASDYTVIEVVPDGRIPTTPHERAVTVSEDTTTTVLFGNALIPGGIEVLKFHDRNGNGVRDPGEGPLRGVRFDASAPCGMTRTGASDDDGAVQWPDLCVGTWTITETEPANYRLTTPGVQTVVVTSNVTSTVIFGNQGLGNLAVVKFEDINGNGVQDPGEGFWSGVNVVYENEYGDTDSCTTDQNGECLFELVPEGRYTVTEILPPNSTPTSSDTYTATVQPSATVTVTFPNRRLGFLKIIKFEDVNGSGARDAGEPAWSGVPMTITNAYGDVYTCTTDANGECLLLDLPRGVYTVTETLPPYSEGVAGATFTTTVPPSGMGEVIIPNRRLGDLEVIKFEDINGNGVRDAGEPLWPGVTITVTNEFGDVDACVTDANGECAFLLRPIGAYTVTEELPPHSAAGSDQIVRTTLEYAMTRTVTFANRRLGALSPHVFWDINGDGVQGPGEPDQPGFSLNYLNAYGETGVGVTDPNGDLLWENLPVGTYTTTLALANGCGATTANPQTDDVIYAQTTHQQFGYRCMLYLPVVLQDWPPPTPVSPYALR